MPDFFFSRLGGNKAGTLCNTLGAIAILLTLWGHPSPAPAVTLDAALNEQVIQIPAKDNGQTVELETTVFKPPGDGPFPLVVMNHGKALGDPRAQGRDRFIALSREFVRRGYAVVVPMRKGFSKSTGEYADPGCDMTAHGELQADDVQSTLEYLDQQPWVDKNRVLVAGQSYGGLTAMAFGTRHFPGVKGLINFAGGLRMHGGDCRWRASLIEAFATYGAHTDLPSLWFYGANDHHFSPQLAAKLHDAYVQAGGHAELVAYGPFKDDAHGMSGSRDGVKIWWPETEKFLKQLGMPTEPVIALADDFPMPKSGYAQIDNVDAIPYLRKGGRAQYRAFLDKPFPRAFAVSASGAWSWAEDGDDPIDQALADCQKSSSEPCRLYAVNDNVVWAGDKVITDGDTALAQAGEVAAPPAADKAIVQANANTPATTAKMAGP
jgi:dienelactone hydrolase